MLNEQTAELVVKEVTERSKILAWRYKLDADELCSFLIAEVWTEVSRKETMANIKGIRRIIKLRTIDYIRDIARFNEEITFSSLSKNGQTNDSFERGSWEEWYGTKPYTTKPDVTILLSDFVKTLTSKQSKVLSMKVGGYSVNDISEFLDIHRNSVRNILKQIKELALDYGLEFEEIVHFYTRKR